MSDFKREERYIVIKRKHLDEIAEHHIRYWLAENNIPTVECVVVESDWPNYDATWEAVQQVAEGTYDSDEITRLQSEVERLENELEGYRALKRLHRLDNYPNEITARAWLLRKQAEAVDKHLEFVWSHIGDRSINFNEAGILESFRELERRLRQQADELEKGGEGCQ